MNIRVFCGKGGVGKTTVAVAAAHFLAETCGPTVVLDYDSRDSMRRTLGVTDPIECNTLIPHGKNLWIGAINGSCFDDITNWKARGGDIKGYLAQFADDTGIVPITDMINSFFGVPADPEASFKFASLVRTVERARKHGIENIIIDVEPTTGLRRLLATANMTVKCLRNLQAKGRFSLMALGMKWPDISHFIKGAFIAQANHYSDRLERVVGGMIQGNYFLVCIPEIEPVEQMSDIRELIEQAGGRVSGYVVNNVRGESHEEELITKVKSLGLPTVLVRHNPRFQSQTNHRAPIFSQIGKHVNKTLRLCR